MYNLNPALYGSVFVVPKDLVEKYIKLASFCAVKSLLWILDNQGGNFSLSDIAKGIGSSEPDVKEALDYWLSEGVLTVDGRVLENAAELKSDSYLLDRKENGRKQPVPVIEKTKPETDDSLLLPTYEQVAVRMDEDKNIAELINHVQFMLGRSTGYDMNARLVQMVDGYGFPFEIILRLIQYCVDIGKTSNAFILSVAKSWYNNEIMTLEQADEYINTHSKAQSVYNEFRMLTGITAPKATPRQEELLVKWTGMKMSVEMIVHAYNITVENTGKISFAYMDKILSSWSANGFKTPEDVEKSKKAQKSSSQASGARSYDIGKAIEESENGEIVYEKKPKRGESK